MAVILLDTLANSLCVAMMLRINGEKRQPLRVMLSALLGAFGAYFLRKAGFLRMQEALFWPVLACMMALAATGRASLRNAGVLLACEGFLGGTVLALGGALGTKGAAWGVGAAFALILSANAVHVRRRAAEVYTVRVRITSGSGTAEFEALVDSGNCLRDYLTRRPVIVLPEKAKEALGLCAMPLRPIFADTAGGRQMMSCFTPRGVWILSNGQETAVSACAAFSPGLSERAPVLLPQSLLTGNQDKKRADREGNAHGEAEG